jgi:hypothetical protein
MTSRFPLHRTEEITVFDAIAAAPETTDIVCDGYSSLVFDVSGPTTFSINVYGSPDGEHWNLLCIIPMTSTVSGPITQITGVGLCGTCVAGLQEVRLTLATLAAQETVSVIARLSTAAFNYPYCCQAQLN